LWYYATVVVTLVVERYEETLAEYERLGFERVLKGTTRGALFRAGPALVEVVEAQTRPAVTRAAAVSGRSAARSRT
jgi:hypothetical protein